MKNTKLLFCIMLGLGLILYPGFIDARTEEEAWDIMFEEVPFVDEKDGCFLDVDSVPYSVLEKNACSFTYDEYVSRHPYSDTYTEEKLQEDYNIDINYCKSSLKYHAFSHISDNASLFVSEDGKEITASVSYDEGTINKSCTLRYPEYDEEVVKTAKEISGKLDYVYTLYGYDVINSFYHYGPLSNDVWNSNYVMYRFPKIKEVLMDYPEFGYDTSSEAGGVGFSHSSGGFIKFIKNDILYGVHYYSANYYGMLLVDKDEEGTTLEKAQRALENHFGENVDFRFDDEVWDIDDSGFDLANKAFGTTGIDYEGIDVTLFIGNTQFNIGAVEMDKKAIKDFEVRAKHKGTGVHVYTNSYEVPVDATLEVEDVTKDMDKVFDKEMYKVHSAYDIDVVKMRDGGFVKTIENGIDVYLPITGKKVGDKLTVYHITDNEKGEGFEGEVVEEDGKLYVKFRTTHFSTYAVAEELSISGSGSIINPNTGDNLGLYIILGLSGLGALVLGIRKFKSIM